MGNTTAAMGHQSTLSINGTSYPFVSESLKKTGQHLERVGIRGTRSHDVDDVVDGPYTVAGQIVLEPSMTEYAALLNLAMGGAALAEELTEFTVIVDRVTAVFTYAGCKINRFSWSSSAGQLGRLTLDIVGKTEAVSGSAPSEPTSSDPIQHADQTVTLASSAREIESLEFILDNACEAKFYNNLSANDIPEGDRIVTFNCDVPYISDHSALYDQAVAGAAGSLAITQGNTTTTLTFAKLQVPEDSPVVPGKGEILLTLPMVARKDGATAELVVS